MFGAGTLSGQIDVRLVSADGEAAWVDGGFGKLRSGDVTGVLPAEAALAWHPRLTDAVTATVTLAAQDGADPVVDVGEAYVSWRGAAGPADVSVRGGLFWPPVSLEHDGLLWAVPDSITPSAINSWVGEELTSVGVEATARGDLGGQGLAATAGVFGHGDTAGTLLTFRGWALHDLKASARGVMPLPPLSPYLAARQAPFTTSVLELDQRLGVYGRLEWRPRPALGLSVFGYDNDGDRTSSNADNEWAWDTRFVQLGLDWRLDGRTRLRGQVLDGETAMGFTNSALQQIWVDVGFSAAYLSVTRDWGPGALTSRLDLFRVHDRTLTALDNNDEDGHAAMIAYRWDVAPQAHLVFEGLRVVSDRPSRVLAGLSARQTQTQLQLAMRYEF